jgi:peptidoglycan hydrolase-like protein with peptidoglycan-binding domain
MNILLKTGSSGANVQRVQGLLNFLGAAQPLLVVDGLFGPMTRAAVVQFQTRSGLVADGIVGPLTSRALIGSLLVALAENRTRAARLA